MPDWQAFKRQAANLVAGELSFNQYGYRPLPIIPTTWRKFEFFSYFFATYAFQFL
jgi:hypothetical protein